MEISIIIGALDLNLGATVRVNLESSVTASRKRLVIFSSIGSSLESVSPLVNDIPEGKALPSNVFRVIRGVENSPGISEIFPVG